MARRPRRRALRLPPATRRRQKAAELAARAARLSGRAPRRNLGPSGVERLAAESSPPLAARRAAKGELSGAPLGGPQAGRASPSGAEREPAPLSEGGATSGAAGAAAGGAAGTLERVSASAGDEGKLHHAGAEERVKQRADERKKKAPGQAKEGSGPATKHLEGLAKLGFAELRIVAAAQARRLARVAASGRRNLSSLARPAGKLGAAKQLSHLKSVDERPEALSAAKREAGVDERGASASEGLPREAPEGRAGSTFDCVFHGQALLVASSEGKNLLKRLGSPEREELRESRARALELVAGAPLARAFSRFC